MAAPTPMVAITRTGPSVGASGPYRYFGEAFQRGGSEEELIAHAAAITGNGEQAGAFLHLRVRTAPGAAPGTEPGPQPAPGPDVPTEMTLAGDAHERWVHVPGGVTPHYQPLARHIERAGPAMNEYAVRTDHGTPGFGVRATLSSGSWLGAGRWLDRTYLHLGTYLKDEAGLVRYGAADILGANYYCGNVPWGDFSVRADPPGRRFTGAWSERWYPRSAATGWTPHPSIAHITDFPGEPTP
ncbi:hypothetical protein ACPA54_30415 [Uniformispora flossi]|uniref:hypothetical protein n=1 Tax=Uniformispora flossi TaxID=3390723 RepID=UPI003C2D446A